MKKQIAVHTVTFSVLALMCASCATTPRQPSDSIAGIIHNRMVENADPGATEISSSQDKTVFSWIKRRHGRKPSVGDSRQAAGEPENNHDAEAVGDSRQAAGNSGNNHDAEKNPAHAQGPAAQETHGEGYPINPGDQLAVSFYRKPETPGRVYRVGCLDRLLISVVSQETITREVVVRVDGSISFYLTKDMQVKGLTIDEIREMIRDRLSSVIPSAEVTVFLSEGNVFAEDFLKRSKDQGHNQYTLATVRPDGVLSLPLIGELNAKGMAPEALRKIAQARYDEIFNHGVAIHLNLVAQRGNTAILGEVGRPGLYPLYEARHPLFGLAMAGGKRVTADLRHVVILKRQPDGSLSRHFVNLKDRRKIDNTQVMLEPQDILIVPMSGIANVNVWVDQYIRRLLPLPTSAGVSTSFSIE